MNASTYPAPGHVYEARFGNLAYRLDFHPNGHEMTFSTIGDGPPVAEAVQTVRYTAVPIRPGVFMVYWSEKDGSTVVHVEDLENDTVHTNITLPDRRFLNLSGGFKRVDGAAARGTRAFKNNKELITAYLKVLFTERDRQAAEQFWDKNMLQHNPGMPDGLDVLRGLLGKIGPEFRYEQGAVMEQDDLVMVHGRYTGWGPKPMVAVDIFRIENGKVVEHWDVMQEEVPADKSANGHAMFPA
jgi:predicted SnoaL-like aldol condensation-catalyzing enzyme